MKFGTHVKAVLGAGEGATLGHFLHHNDDGTDAIQDARRRREPPAPGAVRREGRRPRTHLARGRLNSRAR